MERRKTVATPSNNPLQSAKSELFINTRKSIAAFPSSGLDPTSPDLPSKTRMQLAIEAENQLVIMQRRFKKTNNRASKPEFADGFSLFQTLYPLKSKPKRMASPNSDSFHEANKLIVGPKGSLSEVGSPVTRKSPQKLPELFDTVTIKTLAGVEKRRFGRPVTTTLNLFSWLEEDSKDLLRPTSLGKLLSPSRKGVNRMVFKGGKPNGTTIRARTQRQNG